MTKKQRIIITLVIAAFFMEGLDGSIMNTSLPQIAFSLDTTPLHLKIALTTYLLVGGIFIPMSGWLADKLGTKLVFRTAILIFLFGSILCGFSENVTTMVIGRIIQGIGGALSIPVGRLLFVRNFTKAEFISAFSMVGTFALIGPSIGPLVGGFLTTFFHWRFIFFVNIPVGLFAFYYVQKHIDNEKDPDIKPFDFFGFLILATSLTTLLTGLDIITEHLLPIPQIITVLVLGALGLVLYWFYAKKKDYPIISPKLFHNQVFKKIVLFSIPIRLGLGVIPFMGPLLLQLGLGMSAMKAGIYTGITGLAMIFAKTIVKYFLQRHPAEKVAGVTCFLLFFSFNFTIALCYYSPPWLIIIVFVLNGGLMSMLFTSVNSISYTNIDHQYQSMGSSFLSSFQQILQSFGIAIAAFLLYLFLHGNTEGTRYSLNAFALNYAVLSLLPLFSAICFLVMKCPHSDKPA